MTQKGCTANIIQDLFKANPHQFRERKLCSSPRYQQALDEATTEMANFKNVSADEPNSLEARGLRGLIPGIHGFFYVDPKLGNYPRNVTGAPMSGHLEFRHASKRYKDGWNAGKPDHEDER